jgi:hypothetical protein
MARVLLRLPPEVRGSFTEAQIAALARALDEPASHWIDFRASSRWRRRGIYVRILVGEERRSRRRLLEERHASLVKVLLFAVMGSWIVVTSMLGVVFIAGYLAKSLLGIDLLEGDSLLHGFFFD